MQGDYDIIGLPQYYKTWQEGAPELRGQLKKVGDIKFFTRKQRTLLAKRMQAAGVATDQANVIALMGKGSSLLAVVDPRSLTLLAIIKAT